MGKFDIEDLLQSTYNEWTAPKDATEGAQVFFMHSVTSIDTIKRLQRELKASEEEFISTTDLILESGLARAEELYRKYGAKIFATGRVCGDIIEDKRVLDSGLHWRSIYFAPIDEIHELERPIDISEFRDFIKVSRTGAITKLTDEQAARLNELIDRD